MPEQVADEKTKTKRPGKKNGEPKQESTKESKPEPAVVETPPEPQAPQPQQRYLKPEHKKVIRCINCGHFLCEIIAEFAVVKILCRANPCKTVNNIIIDNNSVHITTEQKRPTVRY